MEFLVSPLGMPSFSRNPTVPISKKVSLPARSLSELSKLQSHASDRVPEKESMEILAGVNISKTGEKQSLIRKENESGYLSPVSKDLTQGDTLFKKWVRRVLR